MKKLFTLMCAMAMVAVATPVDASPPPLKDAQLTITAPCVVVDSADVFVITPVVAEYIFIADQPVVLAAEKVAEVRAVACDTIAPRNRYRWCGLLSYLPAHHSLFNPLPHSVLFASSWRT